MPSHKPDPVSSLSNQQPGDGFHSLSSASLPILLLISRARVFTLHHISKGVYDTWSGLVISELNSILSSPSDMNSWCKFMMLAKCDPSSRHRSWRDTLRIVKDRANHWSEGDFTDLWAEVIAEESRASHKQRRTNLSTNSLRHNNWCPAP